MAFLLSNEGIKDNDMLDEIRCNPLFPSLQLALHTYIAGDQKVHHICSQPFPSTSSEESSSSTDNQLPKDNQLQNIPHTLISTVNNREEIERTVYNLHVNLERQFAEIRAYRNSQISDLMNYYYKQRHLSYYHKQADLSKVDPNDIEYSSKVDGIQIDHDLRLISITQRIQQEFDMIRSNMFYEPNQRYEPYNMAHRQMQNEVKAKSSGRTRGSYKLDPKATKILEEWWAKNSHHPYMTQMVKITMSRLSGLTVNQVNSWISNKRNRTMSTRPKRAKMSEGVSVYDRKKRAEELVEYAFSS
ncbi:unnamed protein product [Dimorphilus gyrociliatus]|uniref:Homeobox domain-containing protein n=1 Tax=Dimorphilus gyrociliatus TaxID=2664684 RepID=A0A7I8W6T9_9ANNE|nr:unnamed protein product [Dimorphilus gyrociliatus]